MSLATRYWHRMITWFSHGLCLGMILPLLADAQLIHNASNLYVDATVQLHVDGAVTNNGFIQNQGDMFVSGDWINTSVYQGLGRLTLKGRTTQRLDNNGNNLYSLRLDASGPVELRDDILIENRIEFTRGVLRVSSPYTLTLAHNVTVAGGSPASFVEGPLDSRGTGYKFLPIGKNGRYYPVELLDVSGIDPVVRVEAFATLPSFRLNDYGRLVSDVYWQQSTVSGTYSGSPVSVGYNLPDDVEDDDLDIFQSPATSEFFSPLGNTNATITSPIDKITTANPVSEPLILIGSRVHVEPGAARFYFPNSISPDAPNPDNRALKVFGEQLVADDFLFIVYNRWGQVVYETRSLPEMSTQGWSGQQRAGGTLSSGAYPYLLKGKLKTGEPLEQKGLISIVR